MSTKSAKATAGEAVPDLEHVTEKTIARCGTARAAVRELIPANSFLERELEMARITNSYGARAVGIPRNDRREDSYIIYMDDAFYITEGVQLPKLIAVPA